MAPVLKIKPQGPLGRWADAKLENRMRRTSGAPNESPQKTHFWNNHHYYSNKYLAHLKEDGWMVFHPGDTEAKRSWRIPIISGALTHLPTFGGWKRFIVLAPYEVDFDREWHIGWKWPGGGGVSRIPIKCPGRVLKGGGPCRFFGIDAITNEQIPIMQIGDGHVGMGGPLTQLPLF